MSRIVVGVDGGGTRTRAVIVDEHGVELGRGEAPGAVVTLEAPQRAAVAVGSAVRAALDSLGASARGKGTTRASAPDPASVDEGHGPATTSSDSAEHGSLPMVLWAGLAGAGAKAPREAVHAALDAIDIAPVVRVGTDVEAAFHDAFGDGPGVLLIAGTGSIAWYRNDDGVTGRVGGWGRHLGDEGSGYWIGTEALRRVVRSEDGRRPPTPLRASLLGHCGLESVGELVAWLERAPKSAVAALTPLVCSVAEEGDPAATEVVDEAIEHLVRHATVAVRGGGGGGEAVPLVLWGGLLAGGGPLRTKIVPALEALPARLDTRPIDPPMGAAGLALDVLRSTR